MFKFANFGFPEKKEQEAEIPRRLDVNELESRRDEYIAEAIRKSEKKLSSIEEAAGAMPNERSIFTAWLAQAAQAVWKQLELDHGWKDLNLEDKRSLDEIFNRTAIVTQLSIHACKYPAIGKLAGDELDWKD